MPVYEFKCESCERDVEIACTVAEHGTETCPACGSGALVRAYRTPPAVHTVGCPSGDFRRLDNMRKLETSTNKKFEERNRDEIAAAKWEILDAPKVDRGEAATRKAGLSPRAGLKTHAHAAGAA